MPNRLATETSPYLLQHKDNPIDWYPWGEEAWARAVTDQKPVFLSVGYSSCHWCHVMAHESFEDPEVAALLNREFIAIKLDREERPDVDDVYMTAVQLSSGHGGWPMSLFLTPDKKPFFAGTYFPRETRGQHPGFLTIIGSLAKAWHDQRADVQKAADEFATALGAALERTLPSDSNQLDVSLLDQAVEHLHQDFDHEHGGFGDRPKFPPHAALRFLLDYAQLRPEMGGDHGDLPERAGHMALFTLEHLALGGIHDHVGGGFHRYSTDERWLLPHFEKMLYDNAQLIGAYVHGTEVAQDPRLKSLFSRTAGRAVEWVRREMTGADGLFYSALDADSDGREGAFYVWHKQDVDDALGERANKFDAAFNVFAEGNFTDEASGLKTGENILHLSVDTGPDFEEDLGVLLDKRALRSRPGLDNKSLLGWCGLMLGALSQHGSTGLAQACASGWSLYCGAGAPHMSTDGSSAGTAFLDDLAYMADGLLDLSDATGEDRWSELAGRMVERAIAEHSDPSGGFWFVPRSAESLFGRTKPFLDNATPSPNGVMARVLRRTGRTDLALRTVQSGLGWVQRMPRATETLLREILWTLWNEENTEAVSSGYRASLTSAVTVALEPETVIVQDDGWGYAEIVVRIPDDVHINSNEPLAKWLSPTTVKVEGVYGEASFPESKEGVYKSEARIVLRVKPKAETTDFELTLRYQACNESECFAPTEKTVTGRLVVP